MPRTITIDDADSGVTTTVVVDAHPETTAPLIRSITFAATNGRGVRAVDLLVLRDFGLALPAELVPVDNPPVLPRPKALGKPAKAAKKAPAKTVATPGRQNYRKAPPDEELLAEYARLGGSPKALAEHYQIPRHTADSWVRGLRRKGLVPATKRAGGE